MFHIMVVEDDAHTRKLMQAVLEQNGYSTVPAGDGEEALEMMDRHHVDLILLDVMMPRMDGFTFLKTLREGNRVLIFPEGTRVKEGQHIAPKGGAAMIAIRAGVKMLPVFIGTTKRLFQKIPFVIGKPYTPVYTERKGTAEEYQKNAEEVMRQVYELGGVQ